MKRMKNSMKCLIAVFAMAMAFVVTGIAAQAEGLLESKLNNYGATVPSASGITVTQTSATNTSVSASWNALAGVSGYEVYYGYEPATSRYVADTTETSVTIQLLQSEYETGNYIFILPYVVENGEKYFNNYRYTPLYPAPQKVIKSSVTYWNPTSKLISAKKYKGEISMTNTGYPDGYAVTVYNLSNKKIKTYTANGSYYNAIVSTEFNIKSGKMKKCWNKGFKYEIKPYKTINGKKYYGPSTGKLVFIPQATITKISSKKITWKKVTGAKGYEIYLSTNSGNSFKKVKKVGKNTTSATISSLNAGSQYQIYVIPYGVKVGKKKYKGTPTITSYYTVTYR